MKSIKMGVIGLGMGRSMLHAGREESLKTEVTVICDVNEEKLMKTKQEFQIPYVTDDYRTLLTRHDLDLIGIFSPDHMHFEMIKDSLEAGKHVIVTKPMVISLEEAKEVVKLVRKHDRKLLVGQTRRFEGTNMSAKKLFDSGKLGRVIMGEASYIHDMRDVFDRTTWRYEHPKDFLYGGACHPIDHLRWFLGDVDEVHAYGATSCDPRYPKDKEINFILNLKFKSGVMGRVANLQGIIHHPKGAGGNAFMLYCDKGTIAGGRVRQLEDGETSDYTLPGEAEMVDFDGKEYRGHQMACLRYVREIENCIINNEQPTVNEIEGAKCTAVSEAAWESIRTGKAVKVFNEF
jgi:predicted dehydrogenase